MAEISEAYIAVGLIDPNTKSIAKQLKTELDLRRTFADNLLGVLVSGGLQNQILEFNSTGLINPCRLNTEQLADDKIPFASLIKRGLKEDGYGFGNFVRTVEDYRTHCNIFADDMLPAVSLAIDSEIKYLALLLEQSPVALYRIQGSSRNVAEPLLFAGMLAKVYEDQMNLKNLIIATDYQEME